MMMKMMMMTIMMIKGFTGIEREMNVGIGRNKHSVVSEAANEAGQ